MAIVTVCVTGLTFTVTVTDSSGSKTDEATAATIGGTAKVSAGSSDVEVEISSDLKSAIFIIDGSSSSAPLQVDDDNLCADVGVT